MNILDSQAILRAAPIWNVGNNVAQFLAWADRIEHSTEHESAKLAGAVLRGFAYGLTGQRTLRPSVRRFLETGTPEQALPWIVRIMILGLTPQETVDFLNREFRNF